MKTHPRVGGEALVSFSCTRAFALSRAIALTRPDFWDPAGLSSDGSVENFKRRRQTELKHGRISMLATMGYITPEITGKFPGCSDYMPFYLLAGVAGATLAASVCCLTESRE